MLPKSVSMSGINCFLGSSDPAGKSKRGAEQLWPPPPICLTTPPEIQVIRPQISWVLSNHNLEPPNTFIQMRDLNSGLWPSASNDESMGQYEARQLPLFPEMEDSYLQCTLSSRAVWHLTLPVHQKQAWDMGPQPPSP